MILDIVRRVRFWLDADRIGPDMLLTHWRLYFRSTMVRLGKKKFKYFDNTADFRPGAYAIGCSRIAIGKRVVIRPGTMLHADTREGGAGITIEDDVLMGSGIHVYVDKHMFEKSDIAIIDQGFHKSREVVIGNGCWIGANAIILPGVTIGRNSVVAAGSIVTRGVPDGVVVAGNPARIMKKIGKKSEERG